MKYLIRFLQFIFGGFLFWALHQAASFILGTPANNIYNDFEPIAQKLLNGEFIGIRYPPLHVIWTALRIKLSQALNLSYFNISIFFYYPVLILSYFQLKSLARYFAIPSKWTKIYIALVFLYPLYILSLHLDLPLIWYTFFLLCFSNYTLKILNLRGSKQQYILWTTLSGVFLGMASLTRPNPLMFPIFFLLILLIVKIFLPNYFKKATIKHLILFFALFSSSYLITIFPWSIYSSLKADKTNILSSGFLPSHRDGLRRYPPYLTKSVVNSEITSVNQAVKFHLNMFQNKPLWYLNVWIKKTFQCWYGSDSGKWDIYFGLMNLVYFIFMGIGLWRHSINISDIFVFSLIIYHWLLSIMVLSIARYQTPVFPFISIYALFGIIKLKFWFKSFFVHD